VVRSYPEVIRDIGSVGQRVAVIGAGGIGVDVSALLTHHHSTTLDLEVWKREWGVTDSEATRGSITAAVCDGAARTVNLLQRANERMGHGWVGPPTGFTAPR
jgi:2,4-dienoyl-CoA reductase (NADPH2)